MKTVKYFFEKIGRNDINETMDNLIEDGIIDSIEIMNLIQEIETYYEIFIDFDYISPEHLRNFQTIKNMIEEVLKNNS
ncbi:acyl carrier protein [Campylobacter sp. IFREMER_LSEM_CL2194]|uniref:acyl carrier protein n=1 Tax=Campylobacter sp. IFREMER_LSEM_CL2194 TaxID=2911621 RepID=UPI0021E7C4FB|nr:acyl carrier protein [Campylobacter sp. IFREMER_LSEM_CL2194]MCV3377627.1 acyl carrier protein [Campylobacter sp. IFREMER_LSEM_CL2194]